jgi:SAM-dependent methyltransferase
MRDGWTGEKIEQFERASEWTGFHENIFREIEGYLEGAGELIDIGCGVGILAKLIAASGKKVTAVDMDAGAIAHIKSSASGREAAGRIDAMASDWEKISDKKKDVLLISFFGNPAMPNIDDLLSMGEKRTIIITHTFSDMKIMNPHWREAHRNIRAYEEDWVRFFDARKTDYCVKRVSYDFGQPFVSTDEARAFLSRYFEPKKVAGRMNDLEETGCEKYPYYLRKEKGTSILVVNSTLL